MTDKNARQPGGKFTARDEQFCREYIIDFNAAQAAIRAGVPEKGSRVQACRLMARPEIQARVAELLAERQERTGINADWVINRIRTVVERSMQTEPVLDRTGHPVLVETPDGKIAPAYAFNANGANKGLEMLGKHLGIFGEDNKQRAPVSTEDIIRALDERDERKRQELREQNGAGVADIRKAG